MTDCYFCTFNLKQLNDLVEKAVNNYWDNSTTTNMLKAVKLAKLQKQYVPLNGGINHMHKPNCTCERCHTKYMLEVSRLV